MAVEAAPFRGRGDAYSWWRRRLVVVEAAPSHGRGGAARGGTRAPACGRGQRGARASRRRRPLSPSPSAPLPSTPSAVSSSLASFSEEHRNPSPEGIDREGPD